MPGTRPGMTRYFLTRRLNFASSRTKASKRAFAVKSSRSVSASSAEDADAHRNKRQMREIAALGEGADEVIHSSELGVRHDTHEQRRHQTNALFISPLQFLPETPNRLQVARQKACRSLASDPVSGAGVIAADIQRQSIHPGIFFQLDSVLLAQ
jgi:hypothetical protein